MAKITANFCSIHSSYIPVSVFGTPSDIVGILKSSISLKYLMNFAWFLKVFFQKLTEIKFSYLNLVFVKENFLFRDSCGKF